MFALWQLLLFLKGFTESERNKLAMLTGILLANGNLSASILSSLFNENLVKEGAFLCASWACLVVFFLVLQIRRQKQLDCEEIISFEKGRRLISYLQTRLENNINLCFLSTCGCFFVKRCILSCFLPKSFFLKCVAHCFLDGFLIIVQTINNQSLTT